MQTRTPARSAQVVRTFLHGWISSIFGASLFFCADCGAGLLPYRDSAGREVSVERHVARSRAKFGKVCCLDCINATRAGDAESETEDSGGQ